MFNCVRIYFLLSLYLSYVTTIRHLYILWMADCLYAFIRVIYMSQRSLWDNSNIWQLRSSGLLSSGHFLPTFRGYLSVRPLTDVSGQPYRSHRTHEADNISPFFFSCWRSTFCCLVLITIWIISYIFVVKCVACFTLYKLSLCLTCCQHSQD
jgi:hypothetical protein